MSGTGARFRQTVIGLQFDGPTWAGAKIGGTAYMDFFGGTSSSLDHLVRLRIATMDLEWKNTTITFGQDKPIISPREPNSLAQVGVSPLTGAGNLWIWQPQARLEQRIAFGESAGLKAQVGVFETAETSNGVPAAVHQHCRRPGVRAMKGASISGATSARDAASRLRPVSTSARRTSRERRCRAISSRSIG